jgi:hypothetical protein
MTKEEILAMEAGQELDALIDKDIFGGNGCIHELYWVDPGEYRCAKCGQMCYEGEGLYSTDISAAWHIVEKMHKQLFSSRLRFVNALQEQTKHTVLGEERVVAWPDVFWSITPEGICKAALLAKYSIKNR